MITMDTCAIIWDALEPTKLTGKAKQAINNADNNSDPAESLIAAASVLNQVPVGTADQNLRNASIVETIW